MKKADRTNARSKAGYLHVENEDEAIPEIFALLHYDVLIAPRPFHNMIHPNAEKIVKPAKQLYLICLFSYWWMIERAIESQLYIVTCTLVTSPSRHQSRGVSFSFS